MDLSTKKYLYSNGSSLLIGAGFEPKEFRPEIREKYEEKGIELPKTQLECSFPYLLSQKLGLECINQAKSGIGLDALVRTTFEWIEKNEDKLEQTVFLLEIPAGIRLDWYVKKWNEFGILNAAKNNKGEYPFTLVKEWFLDDPDEQVQWNNEFYESITQYFNNFYDEDIFRKGEDAKLLFFLSYLEQIGLDYYVSLPFLHSQFVENQLNRIIPEHKNLNIFLNNSNIWRYCEENEWLIQHEVDDNDTHIGFFGNQKLSEKLYEYFK